MANEREWLPLGTVAPESLAKAREELHWAAQLLAAAGYSFVEPVEDQSHANLEWIADGKRLVGSAMRGDAGLRLELAVEELTVKLGGGGPALALEGHSLASAYAWLAGELTKRGYWNSLARPDYAMPYERGENVVFRRDRAALVELAKWYSNADVVLREMAGEFEGASAVRCWPHHFDIATLLDFGDGKSIGVGMTPGDGGYAEPYWYVTPWPYLETLQVAELPGGGHWHREGWFGAVLTGSATVARSGAAQDVRVRDFLRAAVSQGRELLGI